MTVADNLASIKQRIAQAAARAGRDPGEVRIVGAAKGQTQDKILEAVAAGLTIIGHNYVQEAASTRDYGGKSQLHMIGRLQTNKAGKAAELFSVVQTVDSIKLADALDRRAGAAGRIIGVMIQVNLAREPQKSGVDEDEVERLAYAVRNMGNLRLEGLMTMPPFFDDPDSARPYFAGLRDLRDKLIHRGALAQEMNELSMGMTGDFEVAVEEGATLIRVGTALFGPRAS